MTHNWYSISKRLENVETQNRRLKFATLTILLVGAGLLLMGQVRPAPTIEAQKLLIRDADGKVRAELRVASTGVPQLKFYDVSGNTRAILATPEDGSLLAFYDSDGRQRGLLVTSGDNASLNLFDKQGYGAIVGTSRTADRDTGSARQTSAASVVLVGSDGRPLWSAP